MMNSEVTRFEYFPPLFVNQTLFTWGICRRTAILPEGRYSRSQGTKALSLSTRLTKEQSAKLKCSTLGTTCACGSRLLIGSRTALLLSYYYACITIITTVITANVCRGLAASLTDQQPSSGSIVPVHGSLPLFLTAAL